MKISGVYSITCRANGKVYVGGSTHIAQRWRQHHHSLRCGTHHSSAMESDWETYGEDGFEFSVVETVHEPIEILAREQYHIDRLDAAIPEKGFNTSPTAGSNLGLKMSPESRKRISDAQRGRTKSDEHRRKIAQAHLGMKRSDSTRAAISLAVRGKPKSEEHREKCRVAMLGKTHSEATRRKMSETRSGVPLHGQRRFSDEETSVIRDLISSGETYRSTAARFSCAVATIQRVVHRDRLVYQNVST